MADLKSELSSLVKSNGKRKFRFAFAMGKRKDGKGDGELQVSAKKPKKAAISDALENCKEVIEGICWSGKGTGTVYFQGTSKKLSAMLVGKIALTAKRAAGRQFDFQLPSDEEEAEAEKLEEAEDEEEDEPKAGKVPPPPPPPRKKAPAKKIGNGAGQEEGGDVPPAPPPMPGKKQNGPPAKQGLNTVVRRAKQMFPKVKAAGKTKSEEAQEARQLFGKAMALARNKEFEPIAEILDEVDRLILKANADPTPLPEPTEEEKAEAAEKKKGAKKGAPGEKEGGSEEEKTYQKRVTELTDDIKLALKSKTKAGREVKVLFSEARTFARKGDFTRALQNMDEVEHFVQQALGGSATGPLSPDAKSFGIRSKAIQADVKRAVATKSPAGTDAKLKFSEAQTFARKGDYAQARILLDEVEALTEQALSGQEEENQEGEDEQQKVDPQAKIVQTRAKAIDRDVQRAEKLNAQGSKAAREKFEQALAFADNGDYSQARALLDEVEELVEMGMAGVQGQEEDAEEEEEEDDTKLSAEAQSFQSRAQSLEQAVKKALATKSDSGKDANLRLSEARTFARKERYDEAQAALDEVERLAGLALGEGAKTKAPLSPEGKIVQTRAKAIQEDLKRALATKSDVAQLAKAKFSEALTLARKEQFAEARVLLDVVQGLIENALTAAPATEKSTEKSAEKPKQKGPSPEAKIVQTRAKAIQADVKRAAATNSKAGKAAKLKFSEALTKFRKEDYTAARALLDEVEALAKEALTTAEEEEAEAENESNQRRNTAKIVEQRIKHLGSQVEQAAESNTQASKEAKLKFSEAQVFARKEDFDAAQKLLDEVETLVAEALTANADTEGNQANQGEQ